MQDRSGREQTSLPSARALFAGATEGILVHDADDGTILDANPAAARLYGTAVETLIDTAIEELLADAEAVETDLEVLAENDRTVRWQLNTAGSSEKWLDVEVVRANEGDQLISFARDVSADVQSEANLKESQDSLRGLHEIVSQHDIRFEEKVRQLLELGRERLDLPVGYVTHIKQETQTVEAAVGDHESIQAGESAPLSESYCQHTLETENSDQIVYEINDAADSGILDSPEYERFGLSCYIGGTITVNDHDYGTVCFADTEPRDIEFNDAERTFVDLLTQWVGVAMERQQQTEEHSRNQALLNGVFNSQRTQVGITDTEGRVIDANNAALKFVDEPPEKIAGELVWETPWFEANRAHDRCKSAVELALDGERVNFEMEYDPGTESPSVFTVNVRPIFENGEVINVIIEGHEITELRQREQELQQRQKYIDTILNNAPLVLFALDETGEFRHSRGRALEAFGLEDGEMVGESIYEAYDAFPKTIEDFETAQSGEPVEAIRHVGEAVFQTWYRPVEVKGETHVIGISIDITDQQRQKEQVAAVHGATEELMYARTPEEVAGKMVRIVGENLSYPTTAMWLADDDGDQLTPVAATDRALDRLGAGTADDALPTFEAGSFEMGVFEDSETVVVENYTAETDQDVFGEPIKTGILVSLGDHGLILLGSPREQSPSETELDLVGILARNAEAAMVSTNREVELKSYKNELERSNEALQQFAYIASHDLQEPLRMVSSYVDLLDSEYGDELDDEAAEYMEFAVDGANRMQAMVDALLNYSRVETQAGALERTQPSAVVAETTRSLQMRIDETGASVTTGSLPQVRADPDQLGQVFQNLLENAIEYASEAGVEPRVEIDATEANGMVEFCVSDNGPGIPDGAEKDIFEIFKRGGAHETAGTGIGLAVCQRIVQRHGGEIWSESSEEGAIFRFTLPAVTEEHNDD